MDPEEQAALSAELDALEQHRMRYIGRVPGAPVERDDPDVRRLIEALALFSVRTRRIARRNVTDSLARLFRQHYAYLLEPSPASARVVAQTGPNFADPVDVPRGTELHFTSVVEKPGVKQPVPLSMTTVEPLRVVPLLVEKVSVTTTRAKALSISLLSKHARKQIGAVTGNEDSIGELSFEIDHLGEFAASAAVLAALQRCTAAVFIDFEGGSRRPGELESVPVDDLARSLRFGAATPTLAQLRAMDQPLQRTRTFFHNPWSELRFTLRIPQPRSLRAWTRLRIRFELHTPWPRHLVVQRETFRLNSVAVVNLKRDWASPISCEGLRSRYPIVHPLPKTQLRPHSVLGVYRFTPKGPVPMKPSTVTTGPDTFEVEVEGTGSERRMWLGLDYPEAFEQGVTVGVEALWHQTLPKDLDGAQYDVRIAGGFVSNLTWRGSSLIPAGQNTSETDAESLFRILALRHDNALSRGEFVFLLEQLGAARQQELRVILDALKEVRRTQRPYARGVGGLKTVYTLIMRGLDASMIPVVSVVAPRLREFVAVWSREDAEMEIRLPDHEHADFSETDIRLHQRLVVARRSGSES